MQSGNIRIFYLGSAIRNVDYVFLIRKSFKLYDMQLLIAAMIFAKHNQLKYILNHLFIDFKWSLNDIAFGN